MRVAVQLFPSSTRHPSTRHPSAGEPERRGRERSRSLDEEARRGGIAVQDVDDESDVFIVPGGYEKWTLPVRQGVVTVIWTNVTCADVWEAIDDDSWTLCARSAR